ncbi:phospho-N-acetylmuramoyl-pentapeptide-transferase [Myxococcota bacterium]|nr:phospho-N-acetylmuramoyl-pentapeptide-transferase [Myxococcota bacterium]MBU1430900.1 phospho-N-acetylmuramoyl-pentapeptide-transferase [Myxococcota bacterium]MBU1897855.1 phospho-N-acetylmuramoyl-pentapeptide-transferase [Myxococcota bacterium]
MMIWLADALRGYFPPLRVFRYVSLRVIAAMLTAMLISFVLYPWFIRRLQSRQIGQVIRKDGPESHFSKAGTPTMGGSLILFALVIPTILWGDLSNLYVWAALAVTVSFGVVGFVDDYLKLRMKNSKGLSGRFKLLFQFLISALVMLALFREADGFSQELYLPFVSAEKFSISLPLALLLPFELIVIVGTSNAVNLTDGLDGLAIGPVIVAAVTYMILAYSAGAVLMLPEAMSGGGYYAFNIAEYLHLPHVQGVSELAVFAAAIIGAGVGFLWFNSYPAQVFMGDVGSLALGGALGMLAVLSKNELLSVIIGGLFVVEALSVITQTTSYKLTGKRVFRMAPIHHHFEKLGWQEPKIVVRFWIISVMLSLIALASLKIR